MSGRSPTPEQTAAESAWRAVVDAQRDDLALLRQRWADRTAPEVVAAIERLNRRTGAEGEAARAMAAVCAAYGGHDRIPLPIRERLDRYVFTRLTDSPASR